MAPTRTTIPGSGSGRPRSRPTLVLMTEHTPGTPPRSEVTGPQRISRRQLAPASALGRHLRDAAVHVVRTDSPPTVALGVRSEGDRDISQQHARAVIDLALRVGEAMLRGEGLARPLGTVKLIPGTAARMIRVGEETGTLDRQLEVTAHYYEVELDHRLKRLTALFEPAMIVGMGLIVGFVAVAMVSAMYGIFDQVDV